MNGRRGQSAILGLILLIGIVAVVSVGILVHAGQSTADAQQEMENERIEAAFVQLSQTMATTAATGDTTEVVDFAAGEHGAVVKKNTSTMTIDGGYLDSKTIYLGAVEYEGDDGTRIVYEGGAVFRETMDETRVVSAPPLHYKDATFSFPIVEVSDSEETLSGGIIIEHNETKLTDATMPVENDVVEIRIESQYYLGWKNYFEQQVGENSIKDHGEIDEDHGFVEVELGIEELDGDFSHVVYAGGGDVGGHCPSGNPIQGGPVAASGDISCAEEEGDYEELSPINSIVESKVSDNEGATSWDGETTLENGETYYVDGDVYVDDQITVDLDDGNVTLLVDGDLDIRENIQVTGDEDNSLKIFSTGDLSVIGADVDTGGTSSQLQIYGTSEMLVGIVQSDFEGVVYAPRSEAAWDGGTNPTVEDAPGGHSCDVDVCVGGGTGNSGVYGSIIAGPLEVSTGGAGGVPGGHSAIQYDPELENLKPDIADGEILPPELTYLNVVKHNVDVENK